MRPDPRSTGSPTTSSSASRRSIPIAATLEGIAGYDDRITDYSPDATEERVEHARGTLRALDHAPVVDELDRIAADVMRRDLETTIELYDAGEHLRELNVIASPAQGIRMVFDMMPTDTEDDWGVVAARMALVPQALSSYEEALAEGARQGLVAARRQAVECMRQAETWAGAGGNPPFFASLVDRFDECDLDRPVLRDTLVEGARAGHRRLRVVRPIPRPGVRAARRRARRRRRGAVRPPGPRVQRDGDRAPRDVRVGLGPAAHHRARDGRRGRAHPPR